jgi:hypothetical protein
MEIGVLESVLREAVDVWCLDLAAVGGGIGVTEVIAKDDDDVGGTFRSAGPIWPPRL